VDGFYCANWKLTEEDGTATLTIERLVRQPGEDPDAVAAEGTRLIAFLAPDAPERRVEFV
jgi:hypothetical protein